MSTRIHERVAHLREILGTAEPIANDFGALAIAGERLRRELVLEEDASRDAEAALREYDATLVRWRHVAPTDLQPSLEAALAELGDLARAPLPERSLELLEDAFWGVDDVLCAAAGSRRAGVLAPEAHRALAERAEAWARANAQALPPLWPLADALELSLGPDPEHPWAYGWTEPIARFGATTIGLRSMVGLSDPDVRRRVVDRVMGELGIAPARGGELVVVDFRRASAPVRLAAAAPSSGDPAVDGDVVHDHEGVQVRVRELQQDGGSFAVVRVRLAPRVDGDLSGSDAVRVEDEDGRPRDRAFGDQELRLWWGAFSGEGTFRVVVESLELDVAFVIRRGGA